MTIIKKAVNWMNASKQKRVLIHAVSVFDFVSEAENCEAIFGYNSDHYMVVTAESVTVGNNKMSLTVPVEAVKSIFDVCGDIRKEVDHTGFDKETFRNLKIYPETRESALKKRRLWIDDFMK